MKKEKQKYSNSAIIKKILRYVKPFMGLLLLSFFLNTLFSLMSALSVSLINPIIQVLFKTDESVTGTADTIANQSEGLKSLYHDFYDFIFSIVKVENSLTATLVNLSILIIAVFFLKNVFKYLSAVVGVKMEEGIIKSIRDALFKKLTDLSLDFYLTTRQGNLISILSNDVQTLNSNTVSSFTGLLREFIQVVLFLFLLTSISSKLTLIAFSTSIISFLIIRYSIRYLRKYAKRMQVSMADYTTTLQETIEGIRVVTAYNAQEIVNEKFQKDSERFVNSAVKHRKIITLVPSLNEILAIVSLCVVLFVGGSSVLKGTMKAEDLMTFLFVLFSIMSPIRTIVDGYSKFQRGFVAGERVFEILEREPTVISGTEKVSALNTGIEIKNAHFSYSECEVLKNVNFNIHKNKKIAFVGPSGSGKSTMLDLIIRFYDLNKGSIEIDSKDIKTLDIHSYRALFGIVSQDTILFNDTVANNIRYGNHSISEAEVIQAAKQANAYNFIQNLPEGFNSMIGDRGVNLSGGERQRIAIARALVRNPEVLVFDEATSALDAESEKVVQDAINQSLKEKTAILVAHRLATIIDCDEIYVFDKGEIVESGTHKELLVKNGLYRNLYDIQFAESRVN